MISYKWGKYHFPCKIFKRTFILVHSVKKRTSLVNTQGWEIARRFSERIARVLRKNARTRDLLKKTSDSLIHSFLVSDLSDLLMVTHFW